jgi:3D (Asp-Asp-Asp) domain-containing protein
MDRNIIYELYRKLILTSRNVADLRDYISSKYAGSSSDEKAYILADAINKVIDKGTPDFDIMQKVNLRKNIIRTSVHNDSMDINYADVLMECIKIDIEDIAFYKELCRWTNEVTSKSIEQEEIISLAQSIRKYVNKNKDFSLKDIIGPVLDETARTQELHSNYEGYLNAGLSIVESLYLGRGNIKTPAKEFIDKNPELNYIDALLVMKERIRVTANRIFGVINEFSFRLIYLNGSFFKKYFMAAIVVFLIIIAYNITTFEIEQKSNVYSKLTYADNTTPMQYDAGDIKYGINSPDVIEGEEKTDLEQQGFDFTKSKKNIMRATAYDLSVESCGKPPGTPGYGITFSGMKATTNRTVAVDPSVIALGTKLYIAFPEEYAYLDGVYIAEDTGRLVKGDIIDIFLGEDKISESNIHDKVNRFGVQPVEVYFIDDVN